MTTTYPTRSRADLVTQALRILNVVPAGQSPDDEDYDMVDGFVEPLLARIDAESITTVDDPDAIPAAQFMDLAVLLAYDALSDFGLSALPPPHDRTASEVRLRTIVRTDVTLEEVTDYDADGNEITYEQPQTLATDYS